MGQRMIVVRQFERDDRLILPVEVQCVVVRWRRQFEMRGHGCFIVVCLDKTVGSNDSFTLLKLKRDRMIG